MALDKNKKTGKELNLIEAQKLIDADNKRKAAEAAEKLKAHKEFIFKYCDDNGIAPLILNELVGGTKLNSRLTFVFKS